MGRKTAQCPTTQRAAAKEKNQNSWSRTKSKYTKAPILPPNADTYQSER